MTEDRNRRWVDPFGRVHLIMSYLCEVLKRWNRVLAAIADWIAQLVGRTLPIKRVARIRFLAGAKSRQPLRG